MKINEVRYNWNGTLAKRKATKYIILHHRAGVGDVEGIHKTHLANGWSGIGYHFYVRTNGEVYRGRPIDTVGAHCTGYNSGSIGVCFEGNYQTNTKMPEVQLQAGFKLIEFLKGKYPSAEIKRHSDFMATACPGKYFPFDKMEDGRLDKLVSANDITWELSQKIQIDDVDGFVAALEKAKEEDSPLYWGLYKLVNE